MLILNLAVNVGVSERKYYHRSNFVVLTHVPRCGYSPGETCANCARLARIKYQTVLQLVLPSTPTKEVCYCCCCRCS